MRYSVIIPTAFDKCESLLKPCLESIVKFSDPTDIEVIVVANGCTDATEEYVSGMIGDWPIKLVVFEEAQGYPKSINAGIEHATGELVILLNNDTILLNQPKNQWLDILVEPFSDPRTVISGPWKNWCPHSERFFLIFFCVMIRRSAFDTIGPLDSEAFGVGYGEDCDWCCKAENMGYRVAQVPTEASPSYDGIMAHGNFPIYHAGNKTFIDHPDSDLIWRNRAILKARYSTNIGKAKALDGWMADTELAWLAKSARSAQVIAECGSWHGKSTRALADNLPPNGKLYAIDTWGGSKDEQATNHASAAWMEGDHAFDEFCRNMWDHIAAGRVIPIRMHGKNAAKFLLDMGVKADLVFIDAGHGPGEVAADIESFMPLKAEGGVICGHDFMNPSGVWPDVTLDVLEKFGPNVGHVDGCSIWYTNAPTIVPRESKVFDCFPFGGELDMLEFRLKELYDVVDRFIIIEGDHTHSRKPKELLFHANIERFEKYLHKITYIVVQDWPILGPGATETDWSWAYERHQRDAIMRGLTDCLGHDVIIISDLDEIPDPKAIQEYKTTVHSGKGIRSFEMKLFYFNMNTMAEEPWVEAKILPFKTLKELGPCQVRYTQAPVIPNAGNHLSYFGGVDAIIRKINSTAHVEYSTDHFKDPERIKKCIEEGRDIFERPDVKFQKV